MKHINIKHSKILFLFFQFLILFSSCKKDKTENESTSNGIRFDNTTKVNATLLGHILDENGIPVKNAFVKIGNMIKNTNADGIYYFRNINTSERATVITVEKTGYFKQIKTVICTKDQDVYTRIRLTPRTLTGSFAAGVGGEITTNGNAKVSFPTNAIMVDASKATYQGTVNVYAKWIDPRGANISEIMPSDLRGVATNGDEKVLHSYGMMVVELEDASGNKLQIRDGKMVTLTMPIPSAETGSAPGSIPLWFVDETNGMWTEQGSAKKVGANYIGEVSHFSFWNCDVPNDFVNFQVTLVDQFNNPLANYFAIIKEIGTTNEAYGNTNSIGFVSGLVPNNATLEITVFPQFCNISTPIYTQTFTTSSLPVNLGTVIVTISTTILATVNGTLVDCSNLPISNGYVSYKPTGGGLATLIQPNSLGQFSAAIVLCNNPTSYEFTGFDNVNFVNGTLTSSLVPGINTIGNVNACGTVNDFISYSVTINSVLTNYLFLSPTDSIYHNYSQTTEIYSYRMNNNVSFWFDGTNNITGTHNLISFSHFQGTYPQLYSYAIPVTIPVTLTQYGTTGLPVAGSFNGTFLDTFSNPVLVNCSFKATVQ